MTSKLNVASSLKIVTSTNQPWVALSKVVLTSITITPLFTSITAIQIILNIVERTIATHLPFLAPLRTKISNSTITKVHYLITGSCSSRERTRIRIQLLLTRGATPQNMKRISLKTYLQETNRIHSSSTLTEIEVMIVIIFHYNYECLLVAALK